MNRCCDDVAMHCHDGNLYKDGRPYGYRHTFCWRLPQAVVVRPAERGFRIVLNRYPGIVIGLVVQVGARGLSILWGRPGPVVEVPTAGY